MSRLWVVGGNDSGDVRPVGAGVDDDRKHVAVLVDVRLSRGRPRRRVPARWLGVRSHVPDWVHTSSAISFLWRTAKLQASAALIVPYLRSIAKLASGSNSSSEPGGGPAEPSALAPPDVYAKKSVVSSAERHTAPSCHTTASISGPMS